MRQEDVYKRQTVLFATDTSDLNYQFKNISNILIECNYRIDLLKKNVNEGYVSGSLMSRTIQNHMDFGTCLDFLKSTDLSVVNNIVLLHLSDKNSNAGELDVYKRQDNIQCIAYTSPKGSNEILESSPVDIRLAIKEGWYTKNGSKWQTMTQQMLMYRAASFWTSVYAPELSMGMKTEDEIRDIIDIDYEEVEKKEEKKPVIDIDKTGINENKKEPVKNTDEKTVEVKEEKKDENENRKEAKKREKEIKNDVIIDDKGKEILFGENKNLFTENPPF